MVEYGSIFLPAPLYIEWILRNMFWLLVSPHKYERNVYYIFVVHFFFVALVESGVNPLGTLFLKQKRRRIYLIFMQISDLLKRFNTKNQSPRLHPFNYLLGNTKEDWIGHKTPKKKECIFYQAPSSTHSKV